MSDPLVNAVPPRQRALVAASAVSGVGAGLAEAWCVAATGSLLAHLVDGTDPGRGGWLVAAAATAWAVATAAALWCGRSGGYGLSQALHDSLAAQVMRLPLGWFGRSREAELSKLFGGEVMAVMSIPAHLLLPGLRAVTVAVALIGVLAVQSPAAAVVAALWMPVLAAVQVIAGNKVAAGEAALAAARRDAAARLMEFTDGQRSLRMLPDPLHGRTVVAATIDDVSRRMAQVIEPVLGVMGVFSLAVQFMLITVIAAGVIGGNLPGGGIGVVLAATALAG
ncbi:ABC transporter ATP-binding protein, partial [Corynebacterium sp. CCM 8862]